MQGITKVYDNILTVVIITPLIGVSIEAVKLVYILVRGEALNCCCAIYKCSV